MEFLIAILAIAGFAAFVVWRLDVAKKKKEGLTGTNGGNSAPRGPGENADKL